MMIQDSFRALVTPRIDKLVKQNVVIGTSEGKILTTALGIPMSVNPDQVNFHLKLICDYPDKITAALTGKARNDKFPALILNAKGIKYEGDVVTIPEMMLAVWASTRTAADSDVQTIKPILAILADMLEDTLQGYYGVDEGFNLKAEVIYNGSTSEIKTSDKVDAILFTNTKLRIIKNC